MSGPVKKVLYSCPYRPTKFDGHFRTCPFFQPHATWGHRSCGWLAPVINRTYRCTNPVAIAAADKEGEIANVEPAAV